MSGPVRPNRSPCAEKAQGGKLKRKLNISEEFTRFPVNSSEILSLRLCLPPRVFPAQACASGPEALTWQALWEPAAQLAAARSPSSYLVRVVCVGAKASTFPFIWQRHLKRFALRVSTVSAIAMLLVMCGCLH